MSGGHRRYLQGIIPRLAVASEIESILFASPAVLKCETWLPPLPKIIVSECERFFPFSHSPGPILRAALDNFSPDRIYIPIERYVSYRSVPVTIMLQNMAPLSGIVPGFGLKEYIVSCIRGFETRYALRKADSIIVPTAFVREFLIENEGVPAEKVSVVHYGSSRLQEPRAPKVVPAGRIVFTAGSMESYRGLEDLIRALPIVLQQVPSVVLVIAGKARPATEKYVLQIKKLISRLGVEERVFWAGQLEEPELAWYYANASVVAITSRVESFCFVALEAMSRGARIVSSSSACLPEVLGAGASYYKSGDSAELAAKLISWGLNAAIDKNRAAMTRAESFSWDEAAKKTVRILSGVNIAEK